MANDLTTTTGTGTSLSARSSVPPLPAKLAQLVEGDDRLGDLPVVATADRELLAETLEAERTRRMTSSTAVDKGMALLESTLPRRQASQAEGDAYLTVMAEALSDIPSELFSLACKRAAQRLRFMPTPVEVRTMVASELAQRRYRMFRMEQMIERHDREGGPAQPVELVDGSEVTALVSDFRRSLTARGERVPKLAGEMPARVAGPARMPTASDMAQIMGCTVEEAQASMDRAALPDAPAPAKPAAAGGALNFAVRAYCDAIEQGASPADPELAAFYEANHWAVETENERRMLAGEPRKQRAA